MFRTTRFSMLAIMASLGAPALASAQTFSVGAGCQYSDLQPAINAAPTSGAEIHLSKNLTNQHVSISGKSLSIIGGFAGCADAAPTLGPNIVSAGSHTNDSVITISSIANVVLKNLIISDGKETDSGYGGGIDFVGHGSLVLDNVQISNNRAGYGGGINVSPNGTTALRLVNGTSILNNTGAISGGGIRMEGDTRLYMLDGTASIGGNVALSPSDGHGGGLQVIGPAVANIGSGSISGNSARYGAGIYAEGTADGQGTAQLFRTSPLLPARIIGNKAVQTGGGIFVEGSGDNFVGRVCGFGYDISGNSAQEGSAIYADTDRLAGQIDLTEQSLQGNACAIESARSLGAIDCPVDETCSRIDGNIAQTTSGAATDGAAVLVQSVGSSSMEKVQISHNRGGYVFRGFSGRFSESSHDMADCLINDNALTKGVIRTDENGAFKMHRCTVAGNTIGSGSVFAVDGDFTLGESVLWSAGPPVLASGANSLTLSNVMSNDVSTLGGGRPDVVAVTDVKFRNPAQGNYRLSPASPAVDFAVPAAGLSAAFDLDRRPRVVGLTHAEHALDLGAYELQTLALFPPDENFDEVTPPSRPDGWISVRAGGGTDFFTVTTASASAPNALYTDDPATASNKIVVTPEFTVVKKGRVTFKQKVDLQGGDGAAFEIAIGAGQFIYTDIVAAGGRIVTTPYNATIHWYKDPRHSPDESIAAWSGNSGGFQTVTVDLPRSADGQPVTLRWHVGTDASGGGGTSGTGGGYWIDDVHVEVDGSVTDRIFCNGLETTPCD